MELSKFSRLVIAQTDKKNTATVLLSVTFAKKTKTIICAQPRPGSDQILWHLCVFTPFYFQRTLALVRIKIHTERDGNTERNDGEKKKTRCELGELEQCNCFLSLSDQVGFLQAQSGRGFRQRTC